MNDILFLFSLLVIFQVKHLIVDYFLQNTYMLGKFNRSGWFYPLLAHTSMHGVATLIIALYCGVNNTDATMLAIIDIVLHTTIDKFKVEASKGYDKNKDKEFWWWLGIDQFLHHITHYLLIFAIITHV